MQGWFSNGKSLYFTISTDQNQSKTYDCFHICKKKEKTVDKIQPPFMIKKKMQQNKNRREFSQPEVIDS